MLQEALEPILLHPVTMTTKLPWNSPFSTYPSGKLWSSLRVKEFLTKNAGRRRVLLLEINIHRRANAFLQYCPFHFFIFFKDQSICWGAGGPVSERICTVMRHIMSSPTFPKNCFIIFENVSRIKSNFGDVSCFWVLPPRSGEIKRMCLSFSLSSLLHCQIQAAL